MIPLIIIIVILAIIAFTLIGIYNSLVQFRVRADNAWADIDVQLKRRYDLIPNLVETVKGYAAHEKGTFENVGQVSHRRHGRHQSGEKGEAEGRLTYALRGLLAVAEAYPQLRASEQFQSLQGSLTDWKMRFKTRAGITTPWFAISTPRSRPSPPTSLRACSGSTEQFFEITEPTQREPVAVKF